MDTMNKELGWTVQELAEEGMLNGSLFTCVDNTGGHLSFNVGEAYESDVTREPPGLIDKDGDLICASVSRFVPTADKEAFPVADDIVNEPSHYARLAIQPKDYIVRNGFEFWRGNVIKYVSRAGHKLYPGMDEVESEILDLNKSIRNAQMRINQLRQEAII